MKEQLECEIAVFAEINEHMRNTEQKQLSISVAFLGVVAVVLSVLPSSNGKLLNPSPLNFFVYALLAFTGCTVYALQRWYRAWKEHYMGRARDVVAWWGVPKQLCPYWMVHSEAHEGTLNLSFKADNLNVYFTGLLNTFLVAFGSYRWLQWWGYSVTAWASVGLLAIFYLWFLWWASKAVVYARAGYKA